MDILFKNDNFVFSYRVGGILMSDEVVSDKRCKMLDNITDEALMPVSYAIMRNKRAGYQENILLHTQLLKNFFGGYNNSGYLQEFLMMNI